MDDGDGRMSGWMGWWLDRVSKLKRNWSAQYRASSSCEQRPEVGSDLLKTTQLISLPGLRTLDLLACLSFKFPDVI